MKEPKKDIEEGEKLREFMSIYTRGLKRTPPAHALRIILAFLGKPCRWHDEQCTLAEFSAYVARDVMAHIDLAAEARVKVPVNAENGEESEVESDDDENSRRPRVELEFEDIGGGDDGNVHADVEDVPVGERSRFPLEDVSTVLSLCFQKPGLQTIDAKGRKSQADLGLKTVADTYRALFQQEQDFGRDSDASELKRHGYGNESARMLALQRTTLELAKNSSPMKWRTTPTSLACLAALLSLLDPSGFLWLWQSKAQPPSRGSSSLTPTAQRSRLTLWLSWPCPCRSGSRNGLTKPPRVCLWPRSATTTAPCGWEAAALENPHALQGCGAFGGDVLRTEWL